MTTHKNVVQQRGHCVWCLAVFPLLALTVLAEATAAHIANTNTIKTKMSGVRDVDAMAASLAKMISGKEL